MIGKGKKTVSIAHKEKLLADIAYYERRIEEALHKTKHNSFDDVESSDDEANPYTLNAGPSGYELKQQEASLSNRASMTLELAMLTIMQSEVNIMVTPPEVRRPVLEEGTWLEVAAECKIDLVSFTITFYAHKPRRKFAPTRFRSLMVTLTKPAHRKELEGSVLAKQRRPNLALQVLQSYASAFRSRRSTLLELAEKYAEKLRMEAMPEGGYRVKFLDLLTVEWTLDNMWSPIVPFCHRMKFEVEYMPKDYIHTIGRLYKQFKDPSLETSERTEVLAQIFDTCLEAQGPAKDLQESFESDPETAGRLHERRTTIDQEPEIPPSHQVSPKKQPKGKENKAQERKTNMAPPKAIPRKAKKAANVTKKRPNDEVSSDHMDVSKKTKPNDTDIGKNSNDVSKNKTNDINNTDDNRKSVKRATDSDANSNAKKVRTDDKDGNPKSKSGDKSSKNVMDSNGNSSSMPNVNQKNYVQKPHSSKLKSKKVSEKNGDDNTKKSNKGTDETDGKKSNDGKKDDASSDLPNKDDVIDKEVGDTRSKTVKGGGNLKKTKKVNTNDGADSKNKVPENGSTTGIKKKDSKATVVAKDKNPKTSVDILNNKAKKTNHAEKVASVKAVRESDSSKNLNKKPVANNIDHIDAETQSKNKKENLINKNSKHVNISNVNNKNNEVQASSNNINKNTAEDKIQEKNQEKASSKTANKTTKNADNVGKVSEVADKAKDIGRKEGRSKNNTTEATVKAPISKKSDQEKVPDKDNNQKTKQKVDRLTDNKNESAKVQSKPSSKEKVKESLVGAVNKKSKINKDQQEHGNNKVLEEKSSNAKKLEDNVQSKPSSKDKVKQSLDGAVNKKSKINKDQQAHGNNKVLEEKSSNAKKLEDNVQSKPSSKEKVKDSLDGAANKKSKMSKDQKEHGNNKALEEKSSNAKKLQENLRKNDKENGFFKTNTEGKSNFNNDKNKKSTVGIITEKNANTKVNVQDNNKNIINKDSIRKQVNLNETFEVANTKMNLIKAPSNQKNAKADAKLPNANPKVLQKKPVNVISQTVNRFQKQLENQVKIAEKLKTKIPMMKNIKNIKMSVADKGRNVGITKAVEKNTKIPMKSLPVFKKVVKNLPTRISPRKLPSTFKPSTHGFSNK